MTLTLFSKRAQPAALPVTSVPVASFRVVGALLIGLLGNGQAHAEGDAGHGADIFAQECAGCHSVKENKNKMGPSLFAVVGRHSGSVPDFVYSDALKQADLTWTPSQLNAFIAKPQQAVPGVKMYYSGLNDRKARTDLIAYLSSIHK